MMSSDQSKAIAAENKKSARYSVGEEIANTVTHAVGAGLSVAALVVLMLQGNTLGDGWRMLGFSVFGASLCALYLASTIYHAVTDEKLKGIFRMLDHSSIFLLIAGTYTPVLLIAMRGPWGWTLLALIWTMAAGGLMYELFFLGRYKWISLAIYAGMGWLAIVAIKPMLVMLPDGLLLWIVLGGVAYTAGIIFYVWKKLPYHHAIWHVFVLGGSSLHFTGMLLHLT